MIMDAIKNRRSIRKYQDKALTREEIEAVIDAGILAPSSKNRQPWKFYILADGLACNGRAAGMETALGAAKKHMLAAFKRGLERERAGQNVLLPNNSQHIAAAEYSLKIMEEAPVTIFVVNTLGYSLFENLTPEERIAEICNVQSVAAAIENMSLAASQMGLGSLWICDIFFAHQELASWLQADGQLLAALTLGYPAESPGPRPRRKKEDSVVWL